MALPFSSNKSDYYQPFPFSLIPGANSLGRADHGQDALTQTCGAAGRFEGCGAAGTGFWISTVPCTGPSIL